MLRHFAQTVCDAVLLRLQPPPPQASDVERSTGLVSFTRDVPFSPLEDKVTTCVMVAQADNAKVDLTAWALLQETARDAKARVVLQNLAVQWWAHNMKREAMSWWNRNGRDPKNLATILS